MDAFHARTARCARQLRVPALPVYDIPYSTLWLSRVPEKAGDQMHMSMRHGLAKQPRRHSRRR